MGERTYNAQGLIRLCTAAAEFVPMIVNGNEDEVQKAVKKIYAAKEMAEALELVANREGYCVWCERNRPFHHKHCAVDAALAHFRALGGE